MRRERAAPPRVSTRVSAQQLPKKARAPTPRAEEPEPRESRSLERSGRERGHAPRSRSRSQPRKGRDKGLRAKAKPPAHAEGEDVTPPAHAQDAESRDEGGNEDVEWAARAAAGGEGWLLTELRDLRSSMRRTQEQQEQHRRVQQRELSVVKEAVSALQEDSSDLRGQMQKMRIMIKNMAPPSPPRARACPENTEETACEERCAHAIALVDQALRLRLLRFDEALESMRANLEDFDHLGDDTPFNDHPADGASSSDENDSIAALEPMASGGGDQGPAGADGPRRELRVTFRAQAQGTSENPRLAGSSAATSTGSASVPSSLSQAEDGRAEADGAGAKVAKSERGTCTPMTGVPEGRSTGGGGAAPEESRSSEGIEACVDALVRLEKEVYKGFSGPHLLPTL